MESILSTWYNRSGYLPRGWMFDGNLGSGGVKTSTTLAICILTDRHRIVAGESEIPAQHRNGILTSLFVSVVIPNSISLFNSINIDLKIPVSSSSIYNI